MKELCAQSVVLNQCMQLQLQLASKVPIEINKNDYYLTKDRQEYMSSSTLSGILDHLTGMST